MNEIINIGNGAFVKVTMLKGERGSNIASIAKTSTDGLVDTYTITLTDGHTTTFQVTNGANIGVSNLGYVQTNNVAQKAFSVGEHLVLNDQYCVVTQAIAQGATIAIGTNVNESTVGEEIFDLESTKADKSDVYNLADEKADKTEINELATDKANQSALNAEIVNRTNADAILEDEIAIERARIDSIASLPSGSTSGDAELIDIRIGANGIIYENAGAAVRGQFSEIQNELYESKIALSIGNYTDGVFISVDGTAIENTGSSATDFIPVSYGNTYIIKNAFTQGARYIALYNSNFECIKALGAHINDTSEQEVFVNYSDATYMRVTFKTGIFPIITWQLQEQFDSINSYVGLLTQKEYSKLMVKRQGDIRAISNDLSIISASKIKVNAISGYQYSVYQFTGDSGDSTSWSNTTDTIVLNRQYNNCNILFRKPDNSNLSDSDIQAIQAALSITLYYSPRLGDGIFYVATDGSDQNTGKENEPLATINRALALGAKRILISGGFYNGQIDLSYAKGKHIDICNITPTQKVIFKPNNLIIGETASAVSGYSKVKKIDWSTPISNNRDWLYQENVLFGLIPDSERLPMQRGREYRCDHTPIKKCNSTTISNALSEIENATDYRWYHDTSNNILYFSSPMTVSANNPISLSGNSNLFKNGDRSISLKISGIESEQYIINLNGLSNAEIIDCKASLVAGAGCFTYDNALNVKFIRCEACLNSFGGTGDGFNGHSVYSGDIHAKKVTCELIDCWSHDVRDDGYSDHECSETIIRGGLFEYCGKGGVTPSYGSHCSCFNVYSRNNFCGFNYVGEVDPAEGGKYGQLICYTCIAEKNNRGGVQAGFNVDGAGNSLILINCKSINNPTHFRATQLSNTVTLIDCGFIGSDSIKDGEGNFVIKNTNIVS